ncbi:MAG: hypothetical protein V4631_21050 [Pseudomonadota bacterium]
MQILSQQLQFEFSTRARLKRRANDTMARIEQFIGARAQTTLAEICGETLLDASTVRKYVRELIQDGKVHKVSRFGASGPCTILAAGPAKIDADGEAIDPGMEPVHLVVRHWSASRVPFDCMRAFLFGHVGAAQEAMA